jgi:hypothetical protein
LDENGVPYRCRLAEESNFHARACWGPVSGHVVFTYDNAILGVRTTEIQCRNQNRSVHGNLPSHVLYSCVTHSDLEEDVVGGIAALFSSYISKLTFK